MKFQRRLGYFQERFTTLEDENRALSRQVQVLSEARTFGVGRLNLRDAGFLLRT